MEQVYNTVQGRDETREGGREGGREREGGSEEPRERERCSNITIPLLHVHVHHATYKGNVPQNRLDFKL